MSTEAATTPASPVPPSGPMDRRVLQVVVLLGMANLLIVLLSVTMGEYPVTLSDAARVLTGASVPDPGAAFIVQGIRLPRTVAALLVGCAFGVAGAILQGLTRNALAAPNVLGITQSASLLAVGAIVLLPTFSEATVSLFAFVGAALAATIIYAFGWRAGLASNRIVLVGIGVTATSTALVTFLLTFGEIHRVERALVWMIGSVYGRGWSDLVWLAPWLLVALPAAMAGTRMLDALALGDDVAAALGMRVFTGRTVLLLAAVGLVGSGVAAAGAVGFVGLMAPYAARRLVGPRHAGVLPVSALMGAAIVGAADLVARTALSPIELPCGVVTAVLGAPFFVYLLIRRTS